MNHFFGVTSQVFKHIMGIRAIDINLISHGKFHPIGVLHVLLYFSVRGRLLLVKLVARESNNL